MSTTSGLDITEGDPAQFFNIITKLGEGSYGSVYSAIDTRDGTEVAIKVLEVDQADITELGHEINILKTCNNSFIVGYRGCWTKGRYVWIVMEYCAGGSLGDLLLLCEFVLTEAQCRSVLFLTLHGLAYLHQRHLIHRDIKAANILLTRDGLCKLGDFGVSAELTSTMAKRKTAVGTPYWMAPEMLSSSEYDSKADIWSLAITAIELCSGEPPHSQQHPMRVLFLIPSSPPPTIPNAELYSSEFNDFLAQSLRKDPAERASAPELLLHPWFTGLTVPTAQDVVREVVIAHMADLDACRQQETQENAWNADNLIATRDLSSPAGQPGSPGELRGNPNATFKPDMLQDTLSYYSPDAAGGTMVVAPSVKAAILHQSQDFDDGCGTTVLHPDTIAAAQQQFGGGAQADGLSTSVDNSLPEHSSTSSPPPGPQTSVSVTRPTVVVQAASNAPTHRQPPAFPRTPAASSAAARLASHHRHSTATMILASEQQAYLNQHNNQSAPKPLPIPPPPPTTSQYVHRGGLMITPRATTVAASTGAPAGVPTGTVSTEKKNRFFFPSTTTAVAPASSIPGPAAHFAPSSSGTSENSSQSVTTHIWPASKQSGGISNHNTIPRGSPAMPTAISTSSSSLGTLNSTPSTTTARLPPLVTFSATDQTPDIFASSTTVGDTVTKLRQSSGGDVAQMIKALEERRKHDQELLNAYYTLLKKEVLGGR